MWAKFDHWVRIGPFSSVDLSVYRILYSVAAIFMVPSIRWLANYSDDMFDPPFGPFQILSGFPSPGWLATLEILRSIALVCLGFGIFTRWASISVAAILTATYGLTYSLGKIDHTILLILVPAILAFSGWGDRLSIDSLFRKQEPKPAPQWPLRFLALLIGLCFFEAAAIKLGTGWLSPSSYAAQGHFLENLITNDRTSSLAGWAAHLNIGAAWEVLDWTTVILEFSVLAAVPWWRAYRSVLALATLFHLSIYLVMNITFTANVIAYGAFVTWGALTHSRTWFSQRDGRAVMRVRTHGAIGKVLVVTLLAGIVVCVAVRLPSNGDGWQTIAAGKLIIFTGAGIGVAYLLNQVAMISRKGKGSTAGGNEVPTTTVRHDG